MTAPRLILSLAVAAGLLSAAAAEADTGDALATDVKRLEVRTASCEAIGIEFERDLTALLDSLNAYSEAEMAHGEAGYQEIERARIQIDAIDDCATDLESFRDQVGQRLGEGPGSSEAPDAEAGEGDSLESLQVRHDIVKGRIERLRELARQIRDRLTTTFSRVGLAN